MSHYELQFSMDGKNRLELKEYIKKKSGNLCKIMILSPFYHHLLNQSIGTIKQTYLQNRHQNPSNDTFFFLGPKVVFWGVFTQTTVLFQP